jgi:uncharacterized protein (DUF1697 family)
MGQLRALFEALDLARVETFIASGNVIFEAPAKDVRALERQIERQLETALGYAVATFIRTAAQVAAVARYQPFAAAELADEANSLYVAFLPAAPPSAAEQKLLAFRTAIDDFHIHEREVYWLCRKKISESTFSGALLEKALGMPATMRNITTVRRLAAKYPTE